MTKIESEISGHPLSIETGVLARQADGSVVLRYGDSMVLATAVADRREREGIDFFPLTIDYQEKTYGAGKIPGGFFKREGRPSEKEILTSRLIDRTVRPLFPKGFRSETQGIVSVLSFGEENVTDVLGITGVSTALMISDIPFDGPVSAVKIGRVMGDFVVNPDLISIAECDMTLVVAGTDDAVVMVEGESQEVSEDVILEGIELARKVIRELNTAQRELAAKVPREKRAFSVPEVDAELAAKVEALVSEKIKEAVNIPDKMKRQKELNAIRDDAVAAINTDDADRSKEISGIFQSIEKDFVRNMILKSNIRTDGRNPKEIRPIECTVGLLPRVHGSAVFQRGETQALAAVTLGTAEDEQRVDAPEGEYFKNFMLHYNFPPFSVGEARFLRGPGRREIGHGALAEKALRPAMPTKEEFPYTVRIVCDVLESNGSSSMASVCGGTLALMDAGVPIKKPVAGIAMGLVHDGDNYVILTDILGLEDHLGDMDFKVTGTEDGVTAFQMDVKISGISQELMKEALEQARQGRLFIIDRINETLESHRSDLSPHAPRIYTMRVKPEKIREIIGTGGKVIRGIVEETGCKVNVEDDGLVSIASTDEDSAKRAIAMVEAIVEEAVVGKVYKGEVRRITDFGAFIEILPGKDGLLHISQISHERVEKVTDEMSEGDEVEVKVIEIDRTGRIRLSRKELLDRDGSPLK